MIIVESFNINTVESLIHDYLKHINIHVNILTVSGVLHCRYIIILVHKKQRLQTSCLWQVLGTHTFLIIIFKKIFKATILDIAKKITFGYQNLRRIHKEKGISPVLLYVQQIFTKGLSAVKEGLQSYYDNVYSSNDINQMWILKKL